MKDFNLFIKKVVTFYFVAFAAISITIIFNSCSQSGCTDPNAINFNSVAKKDDGTCIYCNPLLKYVKNRTANLIDNNSASPYYNQTVAVFVVEQDSVIYNDLVCGKTGCALNVRIQNLVNQEMELTYLLNGSTNDFYYIKHIIVKANSKTDADTIPVVDNPCANLSFGSLTVVSYNGYIVYH